MSEDDDVVRQNQYLELEQRVSDIETLLQGKMSDGVNGGSIIHIIARVVETVYGPKDDPGGLVHQVRIQNDRMERMIRDSNDKMDRMMNEANAKIDKLFKIVYMGAGAAFVVNIGWMVFTHFHKP